MNAQDETRLRFAAEHPADVLLGHDAVGAARAYAGGWCDSCSCTADRPCDAHAAELRLTGELIDEPRFPWQFVAAFGLAVGFAAGLLLAVALIPDQPDQVIVPVDAPAGFIAPDTGTWSA